MVELLAGGVDHAHQRGVLHRDIKPSNVLLDRPSHESTAASTEPIPRLTDFGLAKLLELTDDETRTGSLLGTPATGARTGRGPVRDIGPATDVYGLGAVLYEMLAGRTPFRGESDVQTLQQVVRNEVPGIGRFRPGISPDLEAICSNAREPARRYASARELADDLHRFLQGEPTVARPANALIKLAKWAKRRPTVAALILISLLASTALATGGTWSYFVQRNSLREIRGHLYTADLQIAQQSLDRRRVDEARQVLRSIRPLGVVKISEISLGITCGTRRTNSRRH